MISDKTEGERLETIFLALEDAAIMIHELRAERDAAYLREPTQAEGDAHEYRNDQSMGASCSAKCPHCAQVWRSALGRLVKANRRKRKARKNLVMYKLVGRRPWDCGPFGEVLDSLTRHLGDGQRLRERPGFLDMSKLAEGMR